MKDTETEEHDSIDTMEKISMREKSHEGAGNLTWDLFIRR